MNPFRNLPLYAIPSTKPPLTIGSDTNSYWVILSLTEAENTSLQEFLSKILKAISLDITNDIFKIFRQQQNFYLYKILDQHKDPKKIICFGINSEELGLSIASRKYELQKLKTHQFIFCDPLAMIQSDPNKKRLLWDSLQLIRS